MEAVRLIIIMVRILAACSRRLGDVALLRVVHSNTIIRRRLIGTRRCVVSAVRSSGGFLGVVEGMDNLSLV